MTSTTDRLGRRRDFGYDQVNRLTAENWYDAGANLVEAISKTWDENGNQLTAADYAGTHTMYYDALNRVTGVVDVWGKTSTFA